MTNVVFFTFLPKIIDIVAECTPPGFQVIGKPITVSDEEKIELVKHSDFLLFHDTEMISEAVLRSAKRIKLLQLFGAGYEKFDLSLLSQLRIPIANMPGQNSEGTAEMAITLMLAIYRRLIHLDQGMKAGKWRTDLVTGFDMFELAGKTVGIIGFGNIGKLVARRIQGFDNTILYYDLCSHPEAEKVLKASRVSLQQLVTESDIITIHAPLTKETSCLIRGKEFSCMKPTAIFINTARGAIVDENALISALQKGQIAGAGLDVFEREPLNQDNPLRSMENVVLTPHLAGASHESFYRRAHFAFKNFQRILAGEKPLGLVQQL
jgi:phosphoglycerate dehydrogenase-like enzyme